MPPRPDEMALLRRLYPTVRWTRVRFHARLPLLLRWRRAAGMVVPLARVHVHLREGLPEARRREVLAHEAWHVLQCQEMGRARFVLRYLLGALRHGFGRAHPMEAPAYAHAARVRAWDGRGEPPADLVARTAGPGGRGAP